MTVVVLGIDTAGPACAVAVWAHGRIIASLAESLTRGQAERLLPMVQTLLLQCGLDYLDIDRFAVTVGPGAFTGLRVGLSAARGMALATGRPLIGLSSLKAAALTVQLPICDPKRDIIVALESRRDDFYVQRFGYDHHPITEPQAVLPTDLSAWVIHTGSSQAIWVGDGTARAGQSFADISVYVSQPCDAAAAVAGFAAQLPVTQLNDHAAQPMYIRPPDVTVVSR